MKKTLALLLVAVGITAGSSYSANKQEVVESSTLTTSVYVVTDNKEDKYVEAVSLDRALEHYPVYLPAGKYRENEQLRISTDHNGEPIKIEKVSKTNF